MRWGCLCTLRGGHEFDRWVRGASPTKDPLLCVNGGNAIIQRARDSVTSVWTEDPIVLSKGRFDLQATKRQRRLREPTKRTTYHVEFAKPPSPSPGRETNTAVIRDEAQG